MIDFEKLAKDIEKLERSAKTFGAIEKRKPEELDANALTTARDAMKLHMTTLRDIVAMFLKDRKEQIRTGHMFKDAAAKSILPTDAAARGDALLIKWGGSVTPTDARAVHEDSIRLSQMAAKIVPVLKAYRKEPG